MIWILSLGLFLPGGGMKGTTWSSPGTNPSLRSASIEQLEDRIRRIEDELEHLARFSMRTGPGAIGYRSKAHENPDTREWIEVDLGGEWEIDEVVLVPMIWKDSRTGFRAEGFPVEFEVTALSAEATGSRVLARFTGEDGILPRIAPLVISCPKTKASRIRVDVSVLSRRGWDNRAILQFSEILVFSGEENVALGKRVSTSSETGNDYGSRRPRFLVDGFTPYLMDAANGDLSVAFLSEVGIGGEPSLFLDLGKSVPVNRVHLHATELSDEVPQSEPPFFSLPHHLRIDGANETDFRDAVTLVDYRRESIYDAGPILVRAFPERAVRYLRLVALEPFMNRNDEGVEGSQIGLAEVEVFSRGRNVALGRVPSADFRSTSPRRTLAAITDGHNIFGEILSTRTWMRQLARRHELETERPAIEEELRARYSLQKRRLGQLRWMVGLLLGGLATSFLLARIARLKQVARLRERLAADLHDELGTSLHVIGLLSDLATGAQGSPAELAGIHRRIRAEVERTDRSVRRCTDMLRLEEPKLGLIEEMKRASERILTTELKEFAVEGKENLEAIPPGKKIDLILFYKECLVNAVRHAGASTIWTEIRATPAGIRLQVGDDGVGLPGTVGVPKSLARRARLLGGRVRVVRDEGGRTRVELYLKPRRTGRFFRKPAMP